MATKLTFEDLCPGYRSHATGVTGGQCCCGLVWDGTMPPHDRDGRPFPWDRVLKRTIVENVAACAREAARNEMDKAGVLVPVGKVRYERPSKHLKGRTK